MQHLNDVLKRFYELSTRLRDIGYVVEIELCSQDEAGYDWIISGGKEFDVIEKSGDKEYEGLSADEVLQRLEAAR